jgi:hypothetical protein
MQVIIGAAADADMKVRHTAYECLVVVAEHYYDKLPPYILPIYNVCVQQANKQVTDRQTDRQTDRDGWMGGHHE